MGSKQRLEMDEDSSMEQKTWQVYSLGKRNVFRLHMNEDGDEKQMNTQTLMGNWWRGCWKKLLSQRHVIWYQFNFQAGKLSKQQTFSESTLAYIQRNEQLKNIFKKIKKQQSYNGVWINKDVFTHFPFLTKPFLTSIKKREIKWNSILKAIVSSFTISNRLWLPCAFFFFICIKSYKYALLIFFFLKAIELDRSLKMQCIDKWVTWIINLSHDNPTHPTCTIKRYSFKISCLKSNNVLYLKKIQNGSRQREQKKKKKRKKRKKDLDRKRNKTDLDRILRMQWNPWDLSLSHDTPHTLKTGKYSLLPLH